MYKEEDKTVKKQFLLLLCLGLCLCLSACDTSDIESPQSAGVEQTAQVEPSSAEPSETPKTGYGVGERAELNDVAVTLTEVEESTGSQFFTPEDGKVFLLCHFDIENNSEEELAVSSILSFEAYVDDYTVSQSLSATTSSKAQQLDGSVAPGKKMAGVIGYEVDANWSALEITFTPDVWNGKDLTFTAQHP